jgi:hypothetical protein
MLSDNNQFNTIPSEVSVSALETGNVCFDK